MKHITLKWNTIWRWYIDRQIICETTEIYIHERNHQHIFGRKTWTAGVTRKYLHNCCHYCIRGSRNFHSIQNVYLARRFLGLNFIFWTRPNIPWAIYSTLFPLQRISISREVIRWWDHLRFEWCITQAAKKVTRYNALETQAAQLKHYNSNVGWVA